MLRPYQHNILEETRNHIRQGVRKIVIESPTGSGKTVLTSSMMKGATEKKKRSWFNVHRKELVAQTALTFRRYGIPFGIIAAGENCGEKELIQICSVGTLTRRIDELEPPDLVGWDECHHIGAATWDRIYQKCGESINIGLSATPIRPGGKTLGKWFDKMVSGPTIPWLIENKYLSEFRYFAPDVPDLTAVRSIGGDYSADDVEKIMLGKAIVGNVISQWKKHAAGRLTIGFAPTIKASKAYVEAFKAAGIRAAHLDGETPDDIRRETTAAFARREIEVLFNVDLFGEGYDLAAQAQADVCIEAVILTRPTKSFPLHKQQVGRGLRPKPEPAIILDHCGNWMRHGFPDDIIKWSLNDKPSRQSPGGSTVAITQCDVCYAVFRPAPACPRCRNVREIKERPLVYLEGELKEMERQAKEAHRVLEEEQKQKRRKEERMAGNYADLKALGEARGYDPKWAYMKAKARGWVR